MVIEARRRCVFGTAVTKVGAGVAAVLGVLAVLLLCSAIASAASPPTFTRTDYAPCLGPTWVEPIDVTGDGRLDLVVAGEGDDSVAVLEGDGHGDFTLASSVPSGGDGPYSLDVAELTGDGHDDVAIVNRWSKTVTILSGDGAGGFTFVRSIAVGTEPIDVKAMDLDEDGDLDLVASQMWNSSAHDSGNLWLLYNNGSGGFATSTTPLPYDGGTVLGVGDPNEDGHVDVAVGHYWATSESVLLGDGDGGLTVSGSLEVGPYPQGAVFDDFDRDGHQDICVTSRYPNNANIFLGNGTGAFTGPTSYAVGQYAKVPIAADLNLDGFLDIAACNYGNDTNVVTTLSILTGHGDGTFDPQTTVGVGGKPHSVAVADFDGDGRLDLAVPNWATDDVSVLLNTTPFTQLDITPPVTTCSADDAWHRGQVTVTFTATDAQSGVAYTSYRVDAGTWQTGTSFPISADGVHDVEYYSVDNAGNTEIHPERPGQDRQHGASGHAGGACRRRILRPGQRRDLRLVEQRPAVGGRRRGGDDRRPPRRHRHAPRHAPGRTARVRAHGDGRRRQRAHAGGGVRRGGGCRSAASPSPSPPAPSSLAAGSAAEPRLDGRPGRGHAASSASGWSTSRPAPGTSASYCAPPRHDRATRPASPR